MKRYAHKFYITEPELAKAKQAAERQGQNLSAYIRQAIAERVSREETP